MFNFFGLCTFIITNKKIKYLPKVIESNILVSFLSFNSNIQTTQSKRYLKHPQEKRKKKERKWKRR